MLPHYVTFPWFHITSVTGAQRRIEYGVWLRQSRRGKMGAGICLFRGWEMGFCALGMGFMKENNRKMGMGFQFEQSTGWNCGI